MRRKGYLWEEIADKDNIKLAIVEASKGKRSRKSVRACLDNPDATAEKVLQLLEDGFEPGRPSVRRYRDQKHGKERLIACPRFFPDQIIHHAAMQVVAPVLLRGMYAHSYGSIKGKGAHEAVHTVERWLRSGKRMRYALTMDVRKFYGHVRPETVERELRRRIKDERTVAMLMDIVHSYEPGLPLGYYTSQWFGNLVLTRVDYLIKEMGAERYIRYMDDMLVLSKSKKKLHAIRRAVTDALAEDGMELKPNWQVYKLGSRPIEFLGYRITREKTVLRRKTFLRIRRRFQRAKRRAPTRKQAQGLMSYYGVLDHADSGRMKEMYVTIGKSELRRLIRDEC